MFWTPGTLLRMCRSIDVYHDSCLSVDVFMWTNLYTSMIKYASCCGDTRKFRDTCHYEVAHGLVCNKNKTVLLWGINTLRTWQIGRDFSDNIFKCIFFNEYGCCLIHISLTFIPKGPVDINPALVLFAWSTKFEFQYNLLESVFTSGCLLPDWMNITPHSILSHKLITKLFPMIMP